MWSLLALYATVGIQGSTHDAILLRYTSLFTPLCTFDSIYRATAAIIQSYAIMTMKVMESALVAFGMNEWMCIAITIHISRFRLSKQMSL